MAHEVITGTGLSKIATAAGTGSQVEITEVALGDGNGAVYTPDGSEAALRNERARVMVDTRYQLNPTDWRVSASFPPPPSTHTVREVGFFDGDGDLIFLTAYEAAEAHQVGGYEYVLDHVLSFANVDDGVAIVDAPDDEVFHHAVLDLEFHALTGAEQARQRMMFEALQRKGG